MTQFNFGTIVASTKSGSGLAADLNAWRDAVHSSHKGPQLPTYRVAGLNWLNDVNSPWEDYVWDGAANALRGFIDPATHRYSTAGNYAKTISSGGVTAKLSDWGTLFNMSGSAAQTVAIETKSTLLAGWWIRVIAQNIAVTIDPFGGETIDCLGTIIWSAGSIITMFYDGTNFYSDQNGGGASAFPVGGVVYVPAGTPPQGFLRMNGTLLSRTTYAGLWGFAQASGNITASDAAWLEGRFSPGDGSTTFRIPDGRGNFIRAWDNSRGIDPSRALGTLQADDFQSHDHTASSQTGGSHTHTLNTDVVAASNGAHVHNVRGYREGDSTVGNVLQGMDDGDVNAPRTGPSAALSNGAHVHDVQGTLSTHTGHTHPITVNAKGGTETRPRNISLLACIKY